MEILAVAHLHSTWSYDGHWSLEDLCRRFSNHGYRVLMMTEHDRGFTVARHNEFREACQRASNGEILVLPGIEYSDAANSVHVLVWGAPFLGEGVATNETLKAVREAGGIAVLAHPSRKEAWRYFGSDWADRLWGIEVWNRKYDGWAPSKTAPALLQRTELMPFVGLDFHTRRQSFPLAMALDIGDDVTEETVLKCMRSRRCYPRAFGLSLNQYLLRWALAALNVAEKSRRIAASIGRYPRRLRRRARLSNGDTNPVHSPSGIVVAPQHHITVCICTYKRPALLKKLLDRLDAQETEGLFSYSVVVSDNDCMRSAEEVVAEFSSRTHIPVTYCVESEQNIALARNNALRHATGNLIAFIDDDEFPAAAWLRNLFKTYAACGADGVLGPVMPYFESEPPAWVRKGKFFERPTHATGFKIGWAEARTGNVLFDKSMLSGVETPFRPQFATAGEDVDFFRRMTEKGRTFVWCNEAVVYEVVPLSRCRRRYLLWHALLRGSNFPKHPVHRLRNATKSLIAVPCYALALPIFALFGEHVFLKYLTKLLDHASRLLAFAGMKLVTQRQI
jgi:glycosyltransferase involved in cell wall biosynthesis